jgi:hypothetical protein
MLLLHAYHALPDIDRVYPRAENVMRVSQRILNHYPVSEGILLMEKIVDIVCKRVVRRIRSVRNVGDLLELKFSACLKTSLVKLMACDISSSDMERIQKLMNETIKIKKYEEELEKKMAEDIKSSDDDGSDSSEAMLPWTGWMGEPKMAWLLGGSWVHAPPLRNVYASSDDYAETLLRMWVLLTFFWGGGAVWPKCRFHKDGGGDNKPSCGEPMLTPLRPSGARVNCRSQGCQNDARWKCYRHKHDAVCDRCLRGHQVKLCGKPGVEASTDIYDGQVNRENVIDAGTMYCISHVKSRKPPLVDPNWKTTYRLNCSVLVGIVKLAAEGEPLTADKRIMWAEVVPMDSKAPTTDEWRNRKDQKMAIRVLTRSDCEGFPDEADSPLETGSRVAIVDMRVFVPEVISILGTFAKETFPEELGRVRFIKSLIGQHEDRHSEFVKWIRNITTSPSILPSPPPSMRNQIETAIDMSNVAWIKTLPSEKKKNLATEICRIPCVTSLSGTQLEAFACALFSDVHCTQGPPGTGKVSTVSLL